MRQGVGARGRTHACAQGEWAQDKCDGRGVVKYRSGDVYTGQLLNGVREGKGKCEYGSGDVYEGDWSADMRHGVGACKYADGTEYEGEWVEDRRHVADEHWDPRREPSSA